jgi:hypothetical protein
MKAWQGKGCLGPSLNSNLEGVGNAHSEVSHMPIFQSGHVGDTGCQVIRTESQAAFFRGRTTPLDPGAAYFLRGTTGIWR